jgi:transcriptional regulator with XRE-family HTH domain
MKSDLDKHIERQLKDKEFRINFDKAEAKRILAQEIALLRKAQHLSQAQLAKEIKTTQQVISRLESPRDKRMPSLELLDRVAKRNMSMSLRHSSSAFSVFFPQSLAITSAC